ncbi:outer membrane beta-barrel protein [Aquimarina intermedia]|uniref:Opacity protein-like surface antigen n=1 Tax=Aquimarina intermedia TaxID=350814 RepID=A0A5S5C500_9FLAO|nr:outer membrane beta-barrel protein [Aquimarina intermedia]TYP73552.1 opacity protein-like surface antigen [Aquimarina intermedia]
MRKIYVLLTLCLLSISSFSQDKKFSIEANYPLAISNGYEKFTGIVNGSFKYRFAKSKLFQYGASLTFDYLKSTVPFSYEDLKTDYFFYHINGFAEMNIASAKNFHPFIGIGFTYLSYEYEFYYTYYEFDNIETRRANDLGMNFKLGAQYDFTSVFFIQTYFHYIRTFNDNNFNNETMGVNNNQLKLGLGFRF